MSLAPRFASARRARRSLLGLALAVPLLACTGTIDIDGHPAPGASEPAPGPGSRSTGTMAPSGAGGAARPSEGGPAASNACNGEAPGAPALRRLSSEELDRSLRVLLGRNVAVDWPEDELVGGYPSARENVVLETHARALYATLLPELRKIVETSPSSLSDQCATADTRCATALVQGFAGRAWRRALSAEERTSLLGFYEQVRQELGDAREATATLLLAILSSPHFLYRTELGTGDGRLDPARRLSSREIGTALGYFFWGQPPDATLLAKMDGDRLRTEGEILAEIERLRGSPAHAAWMGRFFQRWTHVEGLDQKDHNLDRYPDATKAYKKEAEEALVRQFVAVLGKPEGTFEELVSSRSFVAGPLTAKAYRAGARPSGFTTLEADPGRRGAFMSVGFLTYYSKPDRPNALERAKFFLDQVLCRQLPGVPADALQREFTPDPRKSHRQNFETLTGDAACSGCHTMLNPIGFSFDRFGADGQVLREIDGFPIDTRGTIRGAGELDGELSGPEDFILRIARSREARLCFLRQWFQFSNGRQQEEPDSCTLQRLLDTMAKEGDSLATFARHYFTSRNFLYRQAREAP